jgi:NAD+ synthase (glutamine-hydrolysing)
MPVPDTARIALCQINPTVGDIAGNERLIAAGIEEARAAGAQIVAFGELAVTGYPPEDLLHKEHFLREARDAVERLAGQSRGIVALIGFPERAAAVHNAVAIAADGAVAAIYRKIHLPNYGVFDERRYFVPGDRAGVIDLGGPLVGITVCEDIWVAGSPCGAIARAGACLTLNLSASPYHAGKGLERERDVVGARVRETGIAHAFCAIVGGQDELVFDGHSFVLGADGELLARAAQFVEDMLVFDYPLSLPAAGGERHVDVLARVVLPATPSAAPCEPRVASLLEPREAEVHAALVLGLRDYVHKNGFRRVVLGLSGGIDSALVATLAVDALGAEQVSVAVMPSPYSSRATQADARALAAGLRIELFELPIEHLMAAYDGLLGPVFAGREPDIAEENLQARIRGNLLMALSNKFGWLVLATGNKSEMSVGYTTLYGDLAGGFAVIKDIEKTLVYALARWRNRDGSPIPDSILERAPSAELRSGQLDADSLPPYEQLDAILRGYVEQHRGRDELVAGGLPAGEVDRVIELVDHAEYKRRQAPPGIKITPLAFGRDRRMPITNRYHG